MLSPVILVPAVLNGLMTGALYALVALGLTLIYGVLHIINFAHGALLTAAMCRAEGVPSRTAVGLIYVEKASKPYFGFHMWTEAFIDGQWLGLDGTLGEGRVGAGHLKVADNSWHAVESLTPLLPVARILGKTTIEVVSVEAV